jgi:uncharacterized protein YegL
VVFLFDFTDQVPFDGVEFAENPEPRCPCVLLLDTSNSMAGLPINELNKGLQTFKDALMTDPMSLKRVELSVVSFGPVHVETEFQTADLFIPPALHANGMTPMGQAIEKGMELIQQRKEKYRENGISYYRPWMFLITDGAPTDHWEKAAKLINEAESKKSLMFFAVGVQGANMNILKNISVRDPLRLDGLRFRDLFSWLSNSLGSVSRSAPGDTVPLENPVTPGGWGMIE